jgi:hypothetical protein
MGRLAQPLSPHQDVELLPALGEVDPLLDGVGIADVDEGEILQHQPDVGDAGGRGLGQGGPAPEMSRNATPCCCIAVICCAIFATTTKKQISNADEFTLIFPWYTVTARDNCFFSRGSYFGALNITLSTMKIIFPLFRRYVDIIFLRSLFCLFSPTIFCIILHFHFSFYLKFSFPWVGPH